MVCIACLLPLFLVPIVNLLPRIFDYFMAKVFTLLGWEYRKPERAPPACPYKPAVKTEDTSKSVAQSSPESTQTIPKPVATDAELKQA